MTILSTTMIKTCKCGNKFKVKGSSKQVVCNKCLIGTPRREDITMMIKALNKVLFKNLK